MSIDAVGPREQQYIAQTTNQASNPVKGNARFSRYSTCLPAIAKSLNKLIIPLLFLFAMASIPKADAGPAAYLACVEACFAGAAALFPPAIPVCVAACLPLLPAPTI